MITPTFVQLFILSYHADVRVCLGCVSSNIEANLNEKWPFLPPKPLLYGNCWAEIFHGILKSVSVDASSVIWRSNTNGTKYLGRKFYCSIFL